MSDVPDFPRNLTPQAREALVRGLASDTLDRWIDECATEQGIGPTQFRTSLGIHGLMFARYRQEQAIRDEWTRQRLAELETELAALKAERAAA